MTHTDETSAPAHRSIVAPPSCGIFAWNAGSILGSPRRSRSGAHWLPGRFLAWLTPRRMNRQRRGRPCIARSCQPWSWDSWRAAPPRPRGRPPSCRSLARCRSATVLRTMTLFDSQPVQWKSDGSAYCPEGYHLRRLAPAPVKPMW